MEKIMYVMITVFLMEHSVCGINVMAIKQRRIARWNVTSIMVNVSVVIVRVIHEMKDVLLVVYTAPCLTLALKIIVVVKIMLRVNWQQDVL
jgi:hypothetical protein